MRYEQLCLYLFLSGDLKKIILAELCVLSRENFQLKKPHFFLSPDECEIAMSHSCTDDSWAPRTNRASRRHGNGVFVNNSEGFQKSKFNHWFIVSVRGRTAEGAPTASPQTAVTVLTSARVCPSAGSHRNLRVISGVLRQKLAAAHLSSRWTWK